jgi:hypothetical protein
MEVAMWLTCEAIVDAGEFGRVVIDGFEASRARRRVKSCSDDRTRDRLRPSERQLVPTRVIHDHREGSSRSGCLAPAPIGAFARRRDRTWLGR